MEDYSRRLVRKVVIVILNWNGRDVLPPCLASLRLTEYPVHKTVVVDNASSDGSADSVAAKNPEVQLLRLAENLGYAGGNNRGMRYSIENYDPDYVVLLNNDIVIRKGNWLSHMIRVAESDATIGMVNCRLLSPDGTPQTTGFMLMPGVYVDRLFGLPLRLRNAREQSDYVHYAPTVGGPCILVKRALIDAIGFFDERFRPVYFEDIDYSLRAARANFKLVHDGDVSVVHRGGYSSKALPNRFLLYVYRRNLLTCLRLYYPRRVPGMIIFLLLGSFFRAVILAKPRNESSLLAKMVDDLRITVHAAKTALAFGRD